MDFPEGGVCHRQHFECSLTGQGGFEPNMFTALDQFLGNNLIDTHGTSNTVNFAIIGFV